MNDGFTVAAGTQNGKVLIYDLRALGSGGAPARSFQAHSGSHVSCVTFQHAPSKAAKGKPKVGGKENAKPTKAAAPAAPDVQAPAASVPCAGGCPELFLPCADVKCVVNSVFLHEVRVHTHLLHPCHAEFDRLSDDVHWKQSRVNGRLRRRTCLNGKRRRPSQQ